MDIPPNNNRQKPKAESSLQNMEVDTDTGNNTGNDSIGADGDTSLRLNEDETIKEHNKGGAGREFFRAVAFFSQVGITMAACVFVGVMLGKFLDERLGTSPWLLLVFSLLGAGAAFKSLFDLGKK